MPDLQRIVDELSQLSVIEAAELSRMLEDKWGVSASAPTATVAPTQAPVVEVPVQDEFTVILAGVNGDKKINVIKEIRTITGLGLKEAKDFTESAGPGNGKVIKESLNKDDANALKVKLEQAGALVEIK